MLTFDQKDFTKSAMSLAGGMLGVALLAGWRTGGDIQTMSLTLGLPLGVFVFWGIYSLRMKKMAKEMTPVQNHQPLKRKDHSPSAPSPVQIGLKPELLHRGRQGLTLEAARQLPRFRSRAKDTAVTWDGQDNPPIRDQWYM